jgi:hypothetical protein
MFSSKKVFALLFFLTSMVAFSQKVQQVRANAVSAKEVHIYYDLAETKSGELYDVSVYASTDNFSQKLRNVSGNVGKNISAGSQKIVWNAQKSLPEYENDVSFEVRATPQTKKKFKAGYILIPMAVVGLGLGTYFVIQASNNGDDDD